MRELEQAMGAGVHDQATMSRYAEAQARLEHAGGYGWRERAASVAAGSASPTRTSTARCGRSPAAS